MFCKCVCICVCLFLCVSVRYVSMCMCMSCVSCVFVYVCTHVHVRAHWCFWVVSSPRNYSETCETEKQVGTPHRVFSQTVMSPLPPSRHLSFSLNFLQNTLSSQLSSVGGAEKCTLILIFLKAVLFQDSPRDI